MEALQSIALTASSLLADVRWAVLLALLACAATIDCRTYRIPNWLTGAGLLAGVVLSAIHGERPAQDVLLSLGGAATGFAVLLPLYLLRTLGAGDVKLMAMVGAFLGVQDTLWALVFVFATGGLVAIGYAAFRSAAFQLFTNVREIVVSLAIASLTGTRATGMAQLRSAGRIPYGLSICVGTAAFLVARQLAAA